MWTKKLKRAMIRQWLGQFKFRFVDPPLKVPGPGGDEEAEGDEGKGGEEGKGVSKDAGDEDEGDDLGDEQEGDDSVGVEDGDTTPCFINRQSESNGRVMEVDIFPSVRDMVLAGDVRFREGFNVGRYRHSALKRDDITDWPSAMKAVNSDWPEGITILEELLDQLGHIHLDAPKSMKRRSRFRSDDGDEIDYDRMRGGQEYWRGAVRESSIAQKPLTIIAKMGATWNVDPKDLMWAGAAAICLADLLEQNGYAVKVVGCSRVENLYQNGDHHTCFLEVKDIGKPLDKESVVKAFSGWFFRTIYFQSLVASRPEHLADGKGYPTQLHWTNPGVRIGGWERTTQEIADYIGNANALVLSDIWSFEAAVEAVQTTLAGLKEQQE